MWVLPPFHPSISGTDYRVRLGRVVKFLFEERFAAEHKNAADRRTHLLFVLLKNPKSRVFGPTTFSLQLIFILLFLYDRVINIVFYLFLFIVRRACVFS